jgi:hypothetical protein
MRSIPSWGQGLTLLAKVDIEVAYRQIPVHPQDRLLQALRWEGQVYIEVVVASPLPLGVPTGPTASTRIIWNPAIASTATTPQPGPSSTVAPSQALTMSPSASMLVSAWKSPALGLMLADVGGSVIAPDSIAD